MFNAILVSSATGVGKESGKSWYKVSLIAETYNGKGNVILENFCSDTAYYQAQGIESMTKVKVACGVNESGRLTVNLIKADGEK